MTTSLFALTINGHRYGYRELISLCNAMVAMEGIAQWERELYLFILEWLNDSDYVMVNTSGSTGTPKIVSATKGEHEELCAYDAALLWSRPKHQRFVLPAG